MKRKLVLFMLLGFAMSLANITWAVSLDKPTGGLRMNYTKIVVSNLPIGQTISMKKLVNLPLTLGNNFEVPVYVAIEFKKPLNLKPGYEAIPDVNWVVPEAAGLTLPGKTEKSVDVILHIPNDVKLFNRKFQVDVHTTTPGDPNAGGMQFGYKITGSLLFSIAPGRNTEALKRALAKPADAAFALNPPRVDMYNVIAGKTIEVKDDNGQSVNLVNETSKKQKYLLSVVDPKDTSVTPDVGAQFSNHPDDLILERDEIELESGKTTPLAIKIKVPEKIELDKGPLFYLVSIKSGNLQGIERFIMIYLWAGEKMKDVIMQ